MDTYKSKQIEQILKGQKFLGYEIIELLNNGKSAAVFKVRNIEGQLFAVKIFDDDLIERFGHEIQEKRIQQEISLKGHTIPNLVKIIDGGKAEIGEKEYYYIIMELIGGQNLKQFILSSEYDNVFIRKVVETLFNITESLLTLGIVHRDIKPENIMINEKKEVVLMDLGVLKLIGVSSFSDQDEKQFVGTLRYAPPEFLTRNEEDSKEGWKSVNLYQIGGILHDLIMKCELFNEYTPYSNLVLAIKEDAPKIANPDYPFITNQLTRDLLVKDWKKRLTICSNEKIQAFFLNDPNNNSSIENELEDIFSMTSAHKSKFEDIEKITRSNTEKTERMRNISTQLDAKINSCFELIREKGLYQKISRSQLFYFDTDKDRNRHAIKNYLFKIEGNLAMGFSRPLFVLMKYYNDENSFGQISIMAVFVGPFIKADIANPLNILKEIAKEQTSRSLPVRQSNESFNFETFDIFNGTISFDNQFKDNITLEIVKFLKVALNKISTEVKEELERKERNAKGESINTMFTVSPRTIMISKPN
jgi:serine/threonine protein kinase